jgi:predicted RNA polymerase sigma factor
VAEFDAAIDDDIGADLLRLMFTACHPVLSSEARMALTLRLPGGLTTKEIARAFLVPEPTIAQRIVRAKRTLAEAHVPFEIPPWGRACCSTVVGDRGYLPGVQRGLHGYRR